MWLERCVYHRVTLLQGVITGRYTNHDHTPLFLKNAIILKSDFLVWIGAILQCVAYFSSYNVNLGWSTFIIYKRGISKNRILYHHHRTLLTYYEEFQELKNIVFNYKITKNQNFNESLLGILLNKNMWLSMLNACWIILSLCMRI